MRIVAILVVLLVVVLPLAWLVEDGVGFEVAGLRGPVVAAATVDVFIVDVLGCNREELSELFVRDREDDFWNDESETSVALWLSQRTDIGVERILSTLDLLSQELEVLFLTIFTFRVVLCFPGIEQGGHERVVISTTGLTIKHDAENHVIVKILAGRISEDDTVLKVVVLIMECVLRWGVDTETNGLSEKLVADGGRGIEVNASESGPIIGFRIWSWNSCDDGLERVIRSSSGSTIKR